MIWSRVKVGPLRWAYVAYDSVESARKALAKEQVEPVQAGYGTSPPELEGRRWVARLAKLWHHQQVGQKRSRPPNADKIWSRCKVGPKRWAYV